MERQKYGCQESWNESGLGLKGSLLKSWLISEVQKSVAEPELRLTNLQLKINLKQKSHVSQSKVTRVPCYVLTAEVWANPGSSAQKARSTFCYSENPAAGCHYKEIIYHNQMPSIHEDPCQYTIGLYTQLSEQWAYLGPMYFIHQPPIFLKYSNSFGTRKVLCSKNQAKGRNSLWLQIEAETSEGLNKLK